MPKTIDKTYEGQIIGGIFANEDNAEKAVEAFEELNISSDDIEVIVQLEGDQTKDVYTDILSDRGFSESQALYYDKVIRAGKVLVVVSEVNDPAPIIDIFDKFKAEYNPNGSRNLQAWLRAPSLAAVRVQQLGKLPNTKNNYALVRAGVTKSRPFAYDQNASAVASVALFVRTHSCRGWLRCNRRKSCRA